MDGAADLERLAPVELSVVCFRYAPESLRADSKRLDALNKRLMEELQSGGKVFVTGTVLGGRFALRACVLHFGTTEDDVDALVRIVRETAASMVA